jgi:glutamate formiminotransferase
MTRADAPLIECVPNFSEGQRSDVIDAIVAAVRNTEVDVLDVSSDTDHNRTVVTFAGEPEPVIEAAFRAVETAARLIDLRSHSGQHPRIGAADVVPLIPLRNVSLKDCAAYAHQLGTRIGTELALPVYYYEAAATRPERVNLADVRRGGYEALLHDIQHDSARLPDAGPAQLGPAGAVAVGARGPLIAFNAYLNTDDIEIAQQIAVAIRASGGGLPYLKALGLLVDGRAQVSMNVIDFRQTSLFTIMERLREVAAQHGVRVTDTELVGLIPQAALVNTALDYLQLPEITRQRLLETRLGDASGDYRQITFE